MSKQWIFCAEKCTSNKMLLECTNSGMQKNKFRFELLNAWKCERNPKLTYSPIDVLFRFFLFLTRLVSALPRIARTQLTKQNSMFVWSPWTDTIDMYDGMCGFYKTDNTSSDHWHAEWQTEINLPKPVHAHIAVNLLLFYMRRPFTRQCSRYCCCCWQFFFLIDTMDWKSK